MVQPTAKPPGWNKGGTSARAAARQLKATRTPRHRRELRASPPTSVSNVWVNTDRPLPHVWQICIVPGISSFESVASSRRRTVCACSWAGVAAAQSFPPHRGHFGPSQLMNEILNRGARRPNAGQQAIAVSGRGAAPRCQPVVDGRAGFTTKLLGRSPVPSTCAARNSARAGH